MLISDSIIRQRNGKRQKKTLGSRLSNQAT